MNSFIEAIARIEPEGRWANFQFFISVTTAALLTYFIAHFCYTNSYLGVLLVPSCVAIISMVAISLAVLISLPRTSDRNFYSLTSFPILVGFVLAPFFSYGLVFADSSMPWDQTSWLPIVLTIFSGPIITFTLSIFCDIIVRTLIRIFEKITGIKTYKSMRNMLAYDDLAAMIFYGFPGFIVGSSIIGLAIGGLALL